MDPPPPASGSASTLRDGSAAAAPDASEEPGAPATASAASKEAPVTDITDSTQADAQGGLHDTAISNPENNDDTSTSTRGDSHSPRISEEHLGESLVQTTSKQAVNSDGTRKRNFQPGNKEAVHVPSAGSKSHAREISVVETNDARSKFLKKSDNEDPPYEDGKNAHLAGISEELKENNNRSSLNSSSLKDEKKQKNRSRGKENSNHVHNTSTSHDLSLPTSTGTSCLTSMVTENNTEAPKCMGLRLKKNSDEVSLTSSFTVVNAKTTDSGSVNVDSTIQKKCDEVLPGSLKEKETENVATSLGSCVLDSNQRASSNVSLMPPQGVVVDADVKTSCLHSSTEEKVYQSAVSEDATKPSDLASQPNISEEHKNFGSGKHMREAILCTSFNSAGIEKVLPSENQKNQSHPFNEGANFFQTGNADPNFRADVHHRRNIYGSGGMGNSGYEFQRNQSHPFSEGGNFFQLGRADPNFRAGVHHTANIYGSGAMGNSEHGFQRNQSYPFDEGANFFQLGRADPNFREGVHHRMNIYGSGAMGSSEHEFQRNQLYPFDEGANLFQLGRADPNFREGVHHSMNMYESDAMRNSEHGFGRSHLDHTSTERNEMQEKELTCLSTNHNTNRISPSSLAQAFSEKLRMSFPPRHSLIGSRKKKLLILDLNGLLADINEDFHNAHMADAKVRGKLVFRRPYCDDFLNFCIKNFELGVWSSRKRPGINAQ